MRGLKKMKCLQLLLILLLLTASVHSLSPIIIVPGLFGSQLVADLDVSSGSLQCRKNRDSYHLWFNIRLAIEPGYDQCFLDYTKLLYDEVTQQYHDNEGVKVQVPDFGGTDAVEYLNTILINIPYFHKFVDYFESRGYTKGKDLNAAPYDWRYAPDGHIRSGYYQALYQLIEDSYTRNGNTPVTLVVHSMGGPVTLYFLSKFVQSADWKASRIKQFISLAGAFGGCGFTLPFLVSGLDMQYLPFVNPLVFREAMRNFPSLVFLLPSPNLWSSEEALVTLPTKTYTAHDYETLFADMNYENGSRILSEVQGLTADFPAPNVTHYCFYGYNVSTISGMIYDETQQFPDEQAQLSYGDGDGVVNTRSMGSCLLWKDKQELPVVTKTFPEVNHLEIVTDDSVLSAVADIVMQD